MSSSLVFLEFENMPMLDSAPAMIWGSGIGKSFIYFNASWLNFTGFTFDQAINEGWKKAVHSEDLPTYLNTYYSAFDADQPYSIEYRLKHHDGGYRWVTEKGMARYTPESIFVGYIGSCMDIHTLLETGKIQCGQSPENQQQATNEELAATNEELAAANEELAASNEGLIRAEAQLLQLYSNLQKSETRFRSLVQQAPVAIFILNGRELVIETINDKMLEMLGKSSDIIGKTYREAVPELQGQSFFQLLDNVFTSGETYVGNEIMATIRHDGQSKEGYYNFIYQPIKDDRDCTTSIICSAVEVTEQVNARKKVERAEESLRMAIDAAELGSYYINAADRIFVASPRLKEFFGFGPDEEVPYEAAINQIHPDYRQKAADLVEAAFTHGIRFDMEYPVIGYHDGKIRWVRGIGTVQRDSQNKNSYFTGVLHEITEKKQDEIRKDDFIGMASHELKTPLTSLTMLIQLLDRQLKDSADELTLTLVERANVSIRKMSTLIDGFLNVSLLASGKIVINPKEFDLEDLIRERIDEMLLIKSTHIINYAPGPPVLVYGDRDKLGSVLSNLLNNAVKYSPSNSTIDVMCIVYNDLVTVRVKDSGSGINPLDLEKIFDRYYRVESTDTKNISGFGIGLYLCAEIIKRHGGKIWAESQIGLGTAFYFSLALKSPGK